MKEFTALLAAGPAFFLSAWVLMVFVGIISSDAGLRPFGYDTAMVAAIGLWLCIAPAAGAIAKQVGPRSK